MTPINVWAAVSTISSTWRPSRCIEAPPPPSMNATGNDPISSVHWLTFAEISVEIAAPPLPRAAKMVAMMNSGASDASGASHCTSRKRSIPSLRARADQVVGERFCACHDHRGREDEQCGYRDPTRPVGKCAQRGRGADQLGLLDLASAQLVEVEAEPGQ